MVNKLFQPWLRLRKRSEFLTTWLGWDRQAGLTRIDKAGRGGDRLGKAGQGMVRRDLASQVGCGMVGQDRASPGLTWCGKARLNKNETVI